MTGQTAHDRLVGKLKEKQGDQSMTWLASTIGVDQALLSRIYNPPDPAKAEQFGLSALGAIRIVFPDLAPDVDACLDERGRERLARRGVIAIMQEG